MGRSMKATARQDQAQHRQWTGDWTYVRSNWRLCPRKRTITDKRQPGNESRRV
jgi:hypothetical protein